MAQIQGKGVENFEQKLTDRRKAKAAANPGVKFDPFTIISILMALLPLLKECFKPTPASMRRRADGRLAHRRAALAIRRDNPDVSREDADDQAADAQAVIVEMNDADLQLLIDDCCQ